MPYYYKKKKDSDCETTERKSVPLKRKTPMKKVSDKKLAEIAEERKNRQNKSYAKKEKQVTSVKKAATPKSRKKSTLIRELDKVFSQYIRMRDSKEFGYKYFRCISCGQVKSYDQGDAGHYYSRRNMSVRFNELNVNFECKFCNRFSADHLIGYREHLIQKIGQKQYDLLTIEANMTRQWHEFELEQMIKFYKALVAKMVEERDGNGMSRLFKTGI